MLKKITRFRCWSAFEDKCTMDWTSFWFSFDVDRSTFNENMLEKRFLYFRSQWPWPL